MLLYCVFIRWCDTYQSPACIRVYHRPQTERIGHEHVRSTRSIPWIYLISFCFHKYVHYLRIAISSLSLNDTDAGTGRFELFLGHQKAAPQGYLSSIVHVNWWRCQKEDILTTCQHLGLVERVMFIISKWLCVRMIVRGRRPFVVPRWAGY